MTKIDKSVFQKDFFRRNKINFERFHNFISLPRIFSGQDCDIVYDMRIVKYFLYRNVLDRSASNMRILKHASVLYLTEAMIGLHCATLAAGEKVRPS